MNLLELDRELEEKGLDAYLIRDDASNPGLYYATKFDAPDPVVYLYTPDKDLLLVSPLEYSRAEEEASVDEVVKTSRYREGDTRENVDAREQIFRAFLEDQEIEGIGVPGDFPLKLAEDLRDTQRLETVKDHIMEKRKLKTGEELENIREAQKATEKAMEHARSVLKEAEIQGEGLIYREEKLTSELLKREIKHFLIDEDCSVPEETIAASGKDAAKPHATGSGAIRPGEPVIIDIFPRHDSKYFGDMTRTFVKGEPDEEVREMYEAVTEAYEKSLKVLSTGSGVEASELYGEACDVLEEHGFSTLRSDPDTDSGFIHSLGHAVGLELHEPPRLSGNSEKLEEGMVLTVEPGLYVPGVGGVRVEDMVVVKDDGFEKLNSMGRGLEVV
ncbi:MAG: M24 family metallopeptidase [Candidatus Nanohaloarchaea archaeon]